MLHEEYEWTVDICVGAERAMSVTMYIYLKR